MMRGRMVGVVLASLLVCCLVVLYIATFISSVSPTPSPSPTPTVPSMAFHVVQYNIFGRPYAVSKDGQDERLHHIPASIIHNVCPMATCGGVDVVTFAEADIDSERAHMLAAFNDLDFRHHTTVISDTDPFTSLINGGVLIVSKWPILREAQHIYRNACHYSDCLAAKGVKYARINKTVGNTSKAFNVFATHMQAWSTPLGRADRVKQASQFHEFVEALEIPHTEPLIFAGDFNVDNHSFADEVSHLIQLLHATAPALVGAQQYTSDPRTNLLVGRDGAAAAEGCVQQYIDSWGPLHNHTYMPSHLTRVPCHNLAASAAHSRLSPPLLEVTPASASAATAASSTSSTTVYLSESSLCYCPCCPLEWLDYVLYAQAPYEQPVVPPSVEAVVLQTPPAQSLAVEWSSPHEKGTSLLLRDYSDHYPVLGKFEFPIHDSQPVFHLDGCSTDDDCHFHSFRCYCEGAGCFFHGRHTSGSDLPSTHPVNKNCLMLKTRLECVCGPT
ncbi:hypothetical protein H310_10719 [Aphanomyces invadans]|uniref:sphingomyelin phosphodiesterase n=1 Tax=Aphanomyces invadans TaxID=157072 RepID=A0A024TPX6_9STRA|nr:hypothetical protein H310_10719 [Aphanomyces invadans]ETV96078.1 hypothetical protein H310_10719 [Aphanomyces invadans]|eukprot:XP_008875389.1 hypothetical protein H310_10719 [Aphanomyces invadans]